MILLVPQELEQHEVKVELFLHPGTASPADFVQANGKLWQVVTMNGKTSSDHYKAIFLERRDDIRVASPNIRILVPVNPLFLLLPTIFKSKQLPLDILVDLASGDYTVLNDKIALEALEKVCNIEDDMVALDMSKLDAYLVLLMSRVPLPSSLHPRELDEEFHTAYQQFVAFNFMSSWLDQPLQQHVKSLVDFDQLDLHVKEVIRKRDEANTVYLLNQGPLGAAEPKKRPLKGKAPPTKKPANNRSLLDMFKKK